jgi:uncharacterized protein (DUF58 family)
VSDALQAPGVALRAEALIGLRRAALMKTLDIPLAALPGGFVTKRKGHGQDVADVREYVAGDDIRHLDRGTTARTGTLHVRRFQEERDRVSILVADFRPSMLWGTRRAFRSVAAAEALALVGWRIVEEGGRVGLLALGAGEPVVVPARGRARGMLDVIGGMIRAHDAALELALSGVRHDPDLATGLARLERISPGGSEIILASGYDSLGAGFQDRIDELSERRSLRCLRVVDQAAQSLPDGSYPIVLSDGTRTRATVRGARSETVSDQIAGQPVLTIDAGQAPDATARFIAAAFPPDRGA